MIWTLGEDGAVKSLSPRMIQSSTVGQISVYDVNGQMVLETSDTASVGCGRNQFEKSELPKLRKALGIATDKDKLQNVRVNLNALRKAVSDTDPDDHA